MPLPFPPLRDLIRALPRSRELRRLRESEARLRHAQAAGQIGAYERDIATDTVLATREFVALHGLPPPPGDVTWTHALDGWLERLHPEDRDRMAAETAALLARPGPYALEYRILLPDGGTRWLADRGEVFAGARGRLRARGAIRDVTSRREAEDALRESEARLRLAQEAAGIGSWELDLVTGRQAWSERQFVLFGLDPAAPPPDYQAWLALLHPADGAALQARYAESLASPGRFAIEFRIHRANDGALRWISSIGRVEADAAGRPARMLGVNRDVTERRAREQELRAMLEATPIGVLRGDVEGRILDANEALLRLIGRERAELEAGALRWDAITPPEWLPRDAEALAEAEQRGACTPYEKEYLRPDGARVPVLVGYALTGEARQGSVAFILDLTERKRAEAAERLVAQEEELRRIYDSTPAAFHSVDPQGRLIRVSAQWLAFLGYARAEEVLGRRTAEFLVPEHVARWEAALVELRDGGDEVREVEYRMVRRDGRQVDVLLRARAERDVAGAFLRSYSVLIDLTERNAAEARLREAGKLEALGRIAGGVAHDVNNMLQVMTSALKLVENRPEDPARVRRYIRVAQEAAERSAGVARAMLTFARRTELAAGPVEVAAVLEGLRRLLGGTLGRSVALQVAVPPGLPPLRADRAQLDLVLGNLVLNARDAMPAGGTIRIAAAAEPVAREDARGLLPGAYIRLEIEDTGLGMDAATLARAPEPFFTTKEEGRGSGLGLAMAHGFAAQSGGALAIASAPGEGTRVTIWLPQAAAAAATDAAD